MIVVRIGFALAVMVALAGAVGFHPTDPLAAQRAGCAVNPNELTVDGEERTAIDLINSLRAESRAPALSLSSALGQAAAHKSATMATTGAFSHDDPGRSWSQRIRECGYTASSSITENLAMGTENARETVQMWRNSGPHMRNLLDPSMRAIGIARVRGGSGWYWTAAFGGAPDGAGSPTAGSSSTPSAPSASPASLPAPSPSGAPAALQGGSSARVDTGDDDCLNIRSGPGRGATIVTCLPNGAVVRLTAGPFPADGVTWWQLDGLGWAAGEYLKPATGSR
jgi:uncharacterized protein YkwD